ncbi:MAG: iron-containing alcohol dehydrogenase [Mycoplasmatales bacterium]
MNQFKISSTVLFEKAEISLSKYHYENVLLVCDPFLVDTPKINQIISLYTSSNFTLISDVKPDPTLEAVIDGVRKTHTKQPEMILAIGGGSAIDLAKAIKYFTEIINKCSIDLIAIPTTSGSGSEVTAFSVITDTVNNKKIPLVDERLTPKYTILDTDFVLSMPDSVMAFAGIDALTHAIESYVATNASSYSRALALEALKLLFANLEVSFLQKERTAREQIHIAANMAGIAFTNSGLGVNHAIAHQIGGVFHIPHGLTNAILLPHVIKKHCTDQEVKAIYNQLAYELHLTAEYSAFGYKYLLNQIEKISNKLKLVSRFKNCDIDKQKFMEKLDLMAENAAIDACILTNPIEFSLGELKQIIKDAY